MFKLGNVSFLVAEDDALKREIYKLRYKIYVEEFGFEKPEDHPEGYESDIYDPFSIHFAAIDDETGHVIATMRIILNSDIGLPVAHIEEVSFVGDKSILDKIIEVSRFAVHADFRRRKEDILFRGVSAEQGKFERRSAARSTPDRRQRPVIVYGLFRLIYQITKKMGFTHWCMISEKFLFEALSHMGFLFYPIGHEVDYHGLRTPYIAFIDEMESYWITEKPDFILFLAEGLEEQYWPKNDRFYHLMKDVD
ncbi:MAG: PEP-CTERM/exosortase system-associated acyltransferase [Proteobacteria bacterium]|nr:PEP-CTERM/exosortase system-associated acyltransferase [Pseudomonadota bacterium]